MLNKYDANKLMHDIGRITKILSIFKDATDAKAKDKVYSLATAELEKIVEDIEEIKNSNNGWTFKEMFEEVTGENIIELIEKYLGKKVIIRIKEGTMLIEEFKNENKR